MMVIPMTKITAEMIKELRERTNVAMGKCKDALEKAHGDMEQAIDILRKSGFASAVKKEGRETNEGAIGSGEASDTYSIIEVNAETDFVAQNEKFRRFLQEICLEAAETKPHSLEAFLRQPVRKDPSMTIDQYRALIVQTLGENIQIKRLILLPKLKDHSLGIYSHMGGKLLCAVEIGGDSHVATLARDIAMHIAAEAPEYIKPDEVPSAVLRREEDIAKAQIHGKPENMIAKIVEGKMRAFYDQVCLLHQKYVKDNSMTVAELLDKESNRMGKKLTLIRFLRWRVGS